MWWADSTGRYSPLGKLDNSAIMNCEDWNSTTEKQFLDPAADKSAASLPRLGDGQH